LRLGRSFSYGQLDGKDFFPADGWARTHENALGDLLEADHLLYAEGFDPIDREVESVSRAEESGLGRVHDFFPGEESGKVDRDRAAFGSFLSEELEAASVVEGHVARVHVHHVDAVAFECPEDRLDFIPARA